MSVTMNVQVIETHGAFLTEDVKQVRFLGIK